MEPGQTVPHSPDFGKIGKYDLEELVGEGAMGKVYRALDPVLSRAVAIKLMSASISQDSHLRDRFLREARAAANLQHPNIITIYDFGDAGGHPYIAMEYIEGTDLAHIIQDRQPVSLETKVSYVINLLNGLAYAHTKGVVHRDIKPANIRVTADGRVKIMDFGIAHLSGSEMTHSGVVLGTPDYMAPEQVRGLPVTPQTDIWSAGALLYELLTFEKPFSGETLHAVLFKVVTEEPPSITKLNPSLPEALERIVNTALNKEASKRYATADVMAADLTSVRKHLSELETKATLRFSRPLMALELPLRERLARTAIWKSFSGAAARISPMFDPARAWLRRVPVPAPLRSRSVALATGGVAIMGVAVVALSLISGEGQTQSTDITASTITVRDTAPAPASVAVVPAPVPAAPVVAERTTRNTPTRTRPAGDTKSGDTKAGAARPPRTQPVATPPATTRTDAAPTAATADTKGVADAVEKLERAIATTRIREVRKVLTMADSSAKKWEAFFKGKSEFDADFQTTSTKFDGNAATVTFRGKFTYVSAGKQREAPIQATGILEKTAAGWTWKTLSTR